MSEMPEIAKQALIEQGWRVKKSYEAKIARLERELAAERKAGELDKARLDWMERNPWEAFGAIGDVGYKHGWKFVDYRAAIDGARKHA